MRWARGKKIVSLWLVLLICLPLLGNSLQFTSLESEYIDNAPPLKIIFFDKAAPLTYLNRQKEPQGIFVGVVDLILERSGLKGEYSLYTNPEDAYAGRFDLVVGMSPEYAPPELTLSKPIMKIETILYMNKRVNLDKLSHKWFSAVEGVTLPADIDLNYVKYYPSRAESIEAVEKGRADYGYANIFSVAYYTIKDNLKNIVTVPQGQEERFYSIGLLNEDQVLLSIINKVIDSIDENSLNTLIVSEASSIERKITFNMILETYGKWIVLFSILVVVVLIINSITTFKANQQIKLQNMRYEALSQISNECLYEYQIKERHLTLSKQCLILFGSGEKMGEAKLLLSDALQVSNGATTSFTIRLPLINGDFGTFKTTTLLLEGSNSIIGKLIDVSEEMAEKEELLVRSQTDGLSGVLNATAVKEAIFKLLKEKRGEASHFFLLLDIDNFKEINDTYGHLFGDQVLGHLGENLRALFSSQGVVGRIGGDEFCAYIYKGATLEEVLLSCKVLREKMESSVGGIKASMSFGVTEVELGESFEQFFKRADASLYTAKLNGKDQIVVAPTA